MKNIYIFLYSCLIFQACVAMEQLAVEPISLTSSPAMAVEPVIVAQDVVTKEPIAEKDRWHFFDFPCDQFCRDHGYITQHWPTKEFDFAGVNGLRRMVRHYNLEKRIAAGDSDAEDLMLDLLEYFSANKFPATASIESFEKVRSEYCVLKHPKHNAGSRQIAFPKDRGKKKSLYP